MSCDSDVEDISLNFLIKTLRYMCSLQNNITVEIVSLREQVRKLTEEKEKFKKSKLKKNIE